MSEILNQIFTVENLLLMNAGVAAGVLIGAMPGLNITFAVTILLTMTYHLGALQAMCLLLGAYCGGMYGGSITAILINTPGTVNAACTALDGYPLAQKGRASDALKCALWGSTFGGVFSAIVLLFLAPALARLLLNIGSPEYFALCTFGLVATVGVESNSFNGMLKGLLSALLGLVFSCVGADPVFGTNRFAFGSYKMLSGIKIVSAMLGAYAICQIMMNAKAVFIHGDEKLKIPQYGKGSMTVKEFFSYFPIIIKSAIIGTFIGAVPGCGGETSAMLAYNEQKRTSKHPEEMGKGSIEGVIAAETANNATTGGAMIPMLTLSVPGDGVMAILLSALMMQGISPGVKLFEKGSFWVYAVMGSLLVINIFMFLQGSAFTRIFSNVTKIPQSLLIPCIVLMCVMGSFAINNNTFECFVMIAFGIVGFFLKNFDFPVAPMCIALVLGHMFEANLRRSLILSKGSWSIFVTRPVSLFILICSVLILVMPFITKAKNNRKKVKAEEGETK